MARRPPPARCKCRTSAKGAAQPSAPEGLARRRAGFVQRTRLSSPPLDNRRRNDVTCRRRFGAARQRGDGHRQQLPRPQEGPPPPARDTEGSDSPLGLGHPLLTDPCLYVQVMLWMANPYPEPAHPPTRPKPTTVQSMVDGLKPHRMAFTAGLLTQGVPRVPQDPSAPRRGPLGYSPDRESAIGNAPALVPGSLARL